MAYLKSKSSLRRALARILGPTASGQRDGEQGAQWAEADCVGVLPDAVRRGLTRRYSLPGAWMDDLRCAARHEWVAGCRCTWFRVFDPTLVGGGPKTIQAYQDLDRWPSAVLFAGHGLRSGEQELDLIVYRVVKRRICPMATGPAASDLRAA